MRNSRLSSVLAVGLIALAVSSIAARAQAVDVAIVLAADVSRSIDDEEFQLQRRGYAAAVTSPQFLQAIREGRQRAVALCFVEWAAGEQQAMVAKWAVIRDRISASAFAKALLDAPRSFQGRTAIGDAIDFAMEQLQKGPAAARRIIDVSGDGTSNSGGAVTAARDRVVARGITINRLAIINEKTGGFEGTFLYAHTHPPGGLPNYYRDNVVGGPGAFVLRIVNFDTFAEAMTNKLVAEVSGAWKLRRQDAAR
jgi:Protein of unknown function (DUF1194)